MRCEIIASQPKRGDVGCEVLELRNPWLRKVYVRMISDIRFEQLVKRRRSRFTEDCENVKKKPADRLVASKFFVNAIKVPAVFVH